MRRTKELIDQARENGRRRGLAGAAKGRNERLAAALEFEPERPIDDVLLLVVGTWNPRTGVYHYIELRHVIGDGSGKFTVWLDGELWRNGWSRTRFAEWITKQVDRVRVDWG